MKKSLFILIAALAVAAIFVCTQARALEPEFSNPVPVGSSQNQVAPDSKATKTNATSVKFFNHPDASTMGAAVNFKTNSVTLSDETIVDVKDVAATGGLLEDRHLLGTYDLEGGMLDDMLPDPALGADDMKPKHGFCPDELMFVIGSLDLIFSSGCNVQSEILHISNYTDHQLEVGDIRNTVSDTEFSDLFGTSDLLHEAGLIGSAQDMLLPYDYADATRLFPSTIKSDTNFKWQVIAPDPADPAKKILAPIEQSYSHVYTYGLTDVPYADKGGLVTSAYDPVNVEKKIIPFLKLRVHSGPPGVIFAGPFLGISPTSTYPFLQKLYYFMRTHFSPPVFFSKDPDEHRMRLAGYLSWQMHKSEKGSMFEDLLWLARKLFLSVNSSPIATVNIEDATEGGNVLAVVNQGTLGSLEQNYRDNKGVERDFDTVADTVTYYKWRQVLSLDGIFPLVELPDSGTPGNVYFPHEVASYVTFYQQLERWVNEIGLYTSGEVNDNTDDPNEIYDPVINRGGSVPGFALVGPGMFDAQVLVDDLGTMPLIKSLVVPSGESTKDGKFYVYKITPDKSPTLYLDVQSLFPAIFTSPGKLPIGIAGEPYEIAINAADEGFVPYKVSTGNIGRDGCGDMVVTLRGAQTVWGEDNTTAGTDWFDNHEGDQVRFNKRDYPGMKEMFSECIYVYYGQISGPKCIFPSPAADKRICIGKSETDPKWSIAATALGDLDGDGDNDLVVGNMNPMLIAGPAPKYTARVGIFWNKEGDFGVAGVGGDCCNPDTYKQVGYNTTDSGPTDTADAGQYLIKVWEGGDGLAGVSGLDIKDSNILSVQGFPAMLSPFGCPKFSTAKTDTDVESPWEILWSLIYNKRNPGISWGPENNVMPMRCIAGTILGTTTGTIPGLPGGTPGLPGGLPPGTIPPPCIDPPGMSPYVACCKLFDPATTAPGTAADLNACCQAACGTGGDPASEVCGRVTAACGTGTCGDGGCVSSMLTSPKKERFADSHGGDSGSGDGGGSDFARCDKVYDSKAPYIASTDQLEFAQTEKNLTAVKTNQQVYTNIANTPQQEIIWDEIQRFLIENTKLTDRQASGAVNQLKKTITYKKQFFDELVFPFLEMFFKDPLEVEQTKPVEEQPKNESSKWFSLINEAYANPVSEPGGVLLPFATGPTGDENRKSNFRMPRGHDPALPAKREITVILKKTPLVLLENCGNGTWDAGEECDPGDADATPVVPPGHVCTDPTLTCDASCNCVPPGSTPPDCPNGVVQTDLGEECDKLPDDTIIGTCTAEEVCSILCRCVAKTTTMTGEGIPESIAGAPTIVTKCTTFSSPAIESYFNDLNEKARKSLPGLKTSDLFCEAEGMVEASILVPGADKGVGAIIQRNGSLPEDFTQWTELKGTANIATQPIKLLPSDSARAMRVETPDLSQAVTGLSESVTPLSSYIEANVNVGENVYTLNNVLSWEMSTDLTKQVGVEVVVNKIYNRVQPLMKSWSVSGESDAFLKENSFANYDMEQVLSQLSANASLCHDGYCELKAVKGLWPDYQTYSLMLVQGMKSTRAGITLPPVKVEFVNLGTPSAKAMGGAPSCKCDMTAQAPDALSVVALLILTFVVTGGFVAVRILNSPSFVRRGKGR